VPVSVSHVGLPACKDPPPLGNDQSTVRIGQLDHLADIKVGEIDPIDTIGELPSDPYPHTDGI
jgi:hypothetical protein